MHNSYWLHQRSRNSLGTTSFFQSLKMLALIHALTYSFSTIDSLIMSYFVLFRCKLEYTLPACNITATNATKLECVKWRFAALYLSHFFFSYPLQLCCCSYILYRWQGITLMLFFFIIHVSPKSKCYPSMIDKSSLQVPSCNIRNFTQFSAEQKNWPSTRCCKFGMQWYRYRYIE